MKIKICVLLLLPFIVACEPNVSHSSDQRKNLKTLAGQTISTVVMSDSGTEVILITQEGSQFSFKGHRLGLTIKQNEK